MRTYVICDQICREIKPHKHTHPNARGLGLFQINQRWKVQTEEQYLNTHQRIKIFISIRSKVRSPNWWSAKKNIHKAINIFFIHDHPLDKTQFERDRHKHFTFLFWPKQELQQMIISSFLKSGPELPWRARWIFPKSAGVF